MWIWPNVENFMESTRGEGGVFGANQGEIWPIPALNVTLLK